MYTYIQAKWTDAAEHKKIIEKGVPEGATPGIVGRKVDSPWHMHAYLALHAAWMYVLRITTYIHVAMFLCIHACLNVRIQRI